MTYVAPSTVTTLQTYTSAAHNVIVGDIIDHETRILAGEAAWTSYTPTLSQGAATNITKTVAIAKYVNIGKCVTVVIRIQNPAASAAAGNPVYLSLPFAAKDSGYFAGSGMYYDASVNLYYAGMGYLGTADKIGIGSHGAAGNILGASPNLATAASDEMMISVTYEAA